MLLAVGFFMPGMVKVLGIPFTRLGPETPIGYFFSAFHAAELWYRFVGVGQVVAAIFLLFPRTATLGAVLYFPIIANITVVTWAIDFAGTKYITLLMTLAAFYLLCWDYDRLKGILPRKVARGTRRVRRLAVAYAVGFATAGAAAFAALASLRIANMHEVGLKGAVVAGLAGALFGLTCAWHVRGLPEGVESGSTVAGSGDAVATELA